MNNVALNPSEIFSNIHSIAVQERIKSHNAKLDAIKAHIEQVEKSTAPEGEKHALIQILEDAYDTTSGSSGQITCPLYQVFLELEPLELNLINSFPDAFPEYDD